MPAAAVPVWRCGKPAASVRGAICSTVGLVSDGAIDNCQVARIEVLKNSKNGELLLLETLTQPFNLFLGADF